jgi:hypothetical protein
LTINWSRNSHGLIVNKAFFDYNFFVDINKENFEISIFRKRVFTSLLLTPAFLNELLSKSKRGAFRKSVRADLFRKYRFSAFSIIKKRADPADFEEQKAKIEVI